MSAGHAAGGGGGAFDAFDVADGAGEAEGVAVGAATGGGLSSVWQPAMSATDAAMKERTPRAGSTSAP